MLGRLGANDNLVTRALAISGNDRARKRGIKETSAFEGKGQSRHPGTCHLGGALPSEKLS